MTTKWTADSALAAFEQFVANYGYLSANNYDKIGKGKCVGYPNGLPCRQVLLTLTGKTWVDLMGDAPQPAADTQEYSKDSLVRQNKQLMSRLQSHEEALKLFIDNCSAEIAKMKIKPVSIPKNLHSRENLEMHGMRSDDHVGAKITPQSTQGLGGYDAATYKKRLNRWVEKVLTFKEQDSSPLGLNKLVLYYLGDIVTGENIYKGQSYALDLFLTEQLFYALELNTNVILGLAGIFNSVEIFCCPPETQIKMSDLNTKNIADIQNGDEVLTHTGKKKKVTKIMSRQVSGNSLVELMFEGIYDYPLRVTPEHPILAIKRNSLACKIENWKKRDAVCWLKPEDKKSYYPCKNCKERRGEVIPQFYPASELVEGDYLAVPVQQEFDFDSKFEVIDLYDYLGTRITKELKGRVGLWHTHTDKMLPRIIPLTPDFMRLLGYFLAEGHLISGRENRVGICFTFNQKEENYLLDIEDILKRELGLSSYRIYKPASHVTQLMVGSNVLAELFEILCGSGAGNKRLHSKLTSLRPALLLETVRGWFYGDGCFGKGSEGDTLVGVTISKTLKEQLVTILINNKIPVSVSYRKAVSNVRNQTLKSITYHSKAYTLGVFGSFINLIHKGFSSQLDSRSRIKYYDKYLFTELKTKTEVEYSGPVYNFTVEDDESYIANNIAVHNCAIGNHGRPGAKGENHYLTNFDYLLYRMLQMSLRSQENVKVFVSESPEMLVRNGDFNFHLSHGEKVMSYSGTPYYGLDRKYRKLANLYNMIVNYQLIGHFHSPAQLSEHILINGSLVGGDDLSINRMSQSTVPSQKIFYMHPKHGINRVSDLYLDTMPILTPDLDGIYTPNIK